MRISDWSSDVCSSDLVGAAGDDVPVDNDFAHDFAKAKRDDGQIIAAQPQHGKAERNAESARKKPCTRQAHPEGQTESGRQKGSEERRGGKECVRKCSTRWAPAHKQKKRVQKST